MKKFTFASTDNYGLTIGGNRSSSNSLLPCLLFLLVALLIYPGKSPGQVFGYRSCYEFPVAPPSSATTLCESNAGFTPDLTLGTDMNSTTFSSQLPLEWSGSFYYLQNMEIHINGTLLVDQSFLFFGSKVRFGPGAEIVTLDNQYFGAFVTQFFACDAMWKGIRLPGGSTSLSLWYCQIEDAEFAITLAEGVPLSMAGNRLNRNYVGLTNGDGSSVSPGLVVGYFFDNVFTWDEALNPAYPGQTNYNNISFSGMLLTNTAGSFGFSTSTNTFSNMMHGIVMEESDISISRFRFENMVVDDNSGGIGILATKGTLLAEGHGAAFHANALAGIEAHGTNIEVRNYIFTGVQPACIHSVDNTFAQDILIEDNQFTLEANLGTTRGIFLERSIASGLLTHNRIRDNVIVINGTSSARGIEVTGINPALDFLDVSKDTIVTNNTHSSIRGIALAGNATHNNQITDNRVLFNSADSGGDRFGIFLSNSNGTGNNVSRNHVYGIFVDTDNNRHQCSIHSSSSPGVFYCRNIVEDSERGFHFVSNNDNSTLTENTMRASDRGLFISSGQIGTQFRRANVWSTSPTAFQFFAADNNADLGDSRFDIHSPDQQFFPTDNGIDPESGWFFLNEGEPEFCGGILSGQGLSSFEQTIADGTIQQSSMSTAAVWDAEKWLFAKLVAHPELLTPGSLALQFYNAKSGTNLETFVQVEASLQEILVLEDTVQEDYDAYFAQKKSLLNQMADLDAQVAVPQEFSLDFDTAFLAAKNTALRGIESARNGEAAIRNQVLQQRASELDSLSALNDGILPNGIHEENRKAMNEILIKIGLQQALDTNDMAVIEGIAHQCISEGGQVVYLAWVMLPACETEQYQYEEEEICERSSNQGNNSQRLLPTTAKIYPNPVSNRLNVVFPAEVNGTLKLVNANGFVVETTELTNATSFELDASRLPAGFYLLTLPVREGQTETRKIIIIQ